MCCCVFCVYSLLYQDEEVGEEAREAFLQNAKDFVPDLKICENF